MLKNLKIKVCGLSDSNSIRELDAMGLDYLGFIFHEKSPRYIGSNATLAVTKTPKVGVFVNKPNAYIVEQAKKHQLAALQLHGKETPQQCASLKKMGFTLIKAFGIHSNTQAEEIKGYQEHCHYFLYDTQSKQHGGSGQKFDWSLLKELALPGPFFLSGGLGPEDAQEIKGLDLDKLVGIDLNSRFENQPGQKNAAQIQKFINEIKATKHVQL